MKLDWFKITVIVIIILGIIGISFLFSIPILEGLNKCREMNISRC